MFNYGKKGILDKTHKRLFTERSLKNLLKQTGFIIESIEGIPAPFPLAVKHKKLAEALLKLHQRLNKIYRRFFAYQLAIIARVTPNVETLIAQAEIKNNI